MQLLDYAKFLVENFPIKGGKHQSFSLKKS